VQGLVVLAVAAALPFVMNSGNLFDYGLFTLLYALLGLGLNVVVGFAGLLDLGYIAFYGIGAYSYAELASPKYGLHWQAEVAIPVIMIGTALVGLVLGVTSRRLLGDYLAIVTLFFGQAFVVFANNANPHGITGGANGIAPIDPISLFGYKLTSTKGYYYFLVVVVIVVVAALASLLRSRTGRAWKALREDPLAADDDGDAREPVEDRCLRVRRRHRGSRGRDLRRGLDGYRFRRLRHVVADHDLRGCHPRRHRQHCRGDRRRDRDQRLI